MVEISVISALAFLDSLKAHLIQWRTSSSLSSVFFRLQVPKCNVLFQKGVLESWLIRSGLLSFFIQNREFENNVALVLMRSTLLFWTLKDIIIFPNGLDVTYCNCISDNSYVIRTPNKIAGLQILLITQNWLLDIYFSHKLLSSLRRLTVLLKMSRWTFHAIVTSCDRASKTALRELFLEVRIQGKV